ncbi:MAG: response regulator transcription factor [Microbacterium sp.]|uniref:response regulator n=2 Tax=Microbacteriaceae TaxID=85023 RepID=UPI001D178A16|nr:response regulator transcription factor [Microbacterium schleiferi]MCC4267835.1 response regulator transcription factor [Microbacterium schleiferi]MEC8761996.1 response regulator transcription factor [Actinomycetota bacterium]
MSTRVLLVDDHALMRAGFRLILDSAPDLEVVGEAASGEEAVRAASDLRPDVICMDVQMPGMGGLAASRQIVADPQLECAVVIVTTFDRDDYLFEALEAGASGFLLKNAAPEELQAAVRVAAAGDALLAPEVTRRVIARFAAAAPTPTPTAAADLTERESEVLRLMAQAMSNAEIAAHLIIGEATVKTHVSNVLLKLGVRDRVAAVVYAYRHGLS